jgi:anti-sigma factor RsiW
MSCSQYDWKAYALGELNATERGAAEGHAATCAGCREELAGLRLTLDAMSTLREEEVPRRIAFVSDKVFEPRWWQRLWSPTFAAAMLIAAAILVHAFARPGADPAAIEAQVNSAVTKAVAVIEARHEQEAAEMIAAYDLLNKQFRQVYKQTSGLSLQ